MDVTVTALKSFPYRGTEVQRGDTLRMELLDATFYQRYGLIRASLNHTDQTYRTRDLTAQ